jgi:hypothetical protein
MTQRVVSLTGWVFFDGSRARPLCDDNAPVRPRTDEWTQLVFDDGIVYLDRGNLWHAEYDHDQAVADFTES